MPRPARPADVPALVDAMCDGFADDPLYAWLQPDAARRPALLRDVFSFVLARGLERGHVLATPACDGVAVWTAPGTELVDVPGAERYLDVLRGHVGDRVTDVVAGMAAVERHEPTEPHATLHSLVVRAGRQGGGIGRALVEPLLGGCDAAGVAAWLDATHPRAVPFYERLGFAVVGEERVPGGGPLVWAMVRRPGATRRGAASGRCAPV